VKDINLTQACSSHSATCGPDSTCRGWDPSMAAMLAFGVLGQVSVIVAGPSTGLLAVGKAGYLPKFFQGTNKNGIQVPILVFQGVIVSILALALTVLPSVQSAYQILGQMATIIILVMYVVMYTAALRLRHTQPNKPRPFRVPALWLVGSVGVIAAVAAFILSFVPPQQIATGSPGLVRRHPRRRQRDLPRHSVCDLRAAQEGLEIGRYRLRSLRLANRRSQAERGLHLAQRRRSGGTPGGSRAGDAGRGVGAPSGYDGLSDGEVLDERVECRGARIGAMVGAGSSRCSGRSS